MARPKTDLVDVNMYVDVKDWWGCACVKRAKNRKLTHVQINHPSVKRCRKCGCKKPT